MMVKLLCNRRPVLYTLLRAVKYLVEEHQVDVDVKDNAGRMLLYHACERGREEIITYLLEECRYGNHLATCDTVSNIESERDNLN